MYAKFDSDPDLDDDMEKDSPEPSVNEKHPNGQIPGWPHATPSTFANTPIVKIKVGKTITASSEFLVHEAILNKLKFFEAALKGDFRDASIKVIKLPEDDPVMMGCLVEFLYTGDYTNHASAANTKNADPSCPLESLQNMYARKLYDARVLVLGEKYACKGLCEKSLEKLCTTRGKFVTTTSHHTDANCAFLAYVHRLYELSGPDSALRIPQNLGVNPRGATSTQAKAVIEWDAQQIVTWIGAMQKDAVQKMVMDATFESCPELAKDLLTYTAVGLMESTKAFLVKGLGQWQKVYPEGGPILF